MPAIYQKIPLSGSTDGAFILIANISSPGAIVHTASSVSNEIDEVFLYAYNIGLEDYQLNIDWASSAGANKFMVPFQKPPKLIIPGLVIKNSKTIRVWVEAAASNLICIGGYVNRRIEL